MMILMNWQDWVELEAHGGELIDIQLGIILFEEADDMPSISTVQYFHAIIL